MLRSSQHKSQTLHLLPTTSPSPTFPVHLTLCPPSPPCPPPTSSPYILPGSLLTRTCTHKQVHTHTLCTLSSLAWGVWRPSGWGAIWVAERARREGVKQWRPEACVGWNRAVSRKAALRKIEEPFSCHIKLHQLSTMGLCSDRGGLPLLWRLIISAMELLPNTAFHWPNLDSIKEEEGRDRGGGDMNSNEL